MDIAGAPLSGPLAPSAESAAPAPVRIERGSPVWLVDCIGSFLAIPWKVILLSLRVGNRNISRATEERIAGFARRHGLSGVVVRLNQYSPGGEMDALGRNSRVSALLRIILGIPYMLNYALFPWRLFGGDCYNPLGDTVHVFSDHSGIALHEMGHALDFSRRKSPGLYLLLRFLPFVPLWQEYLASRYAIEYLREVGDVEGVKRAYRVLCPAFATYVLGECVPAQVRIIFLFPLIMLGHVVGLALAAMEGRGL